MPALDRSNIIAVIGAGAMGAGIAQVAASAGHDVLLFDAVDGAAQRGIDNTAKGLAKLVERGRMTQQDCDALIARINVAQSLTDVSSASLVIEAIVEQLDIKQTLFCQLEDLCREDTILASNTSSLSITAIGSTLKRPERLLGMHFFNPAPVMKLVEVISGLATDPGVAECVFGTATRWGKLAVHARSTPGFIVNRVARPFYAEALRLLQEGAGDPSTIDAVMRDCGGFRMGPFELMDLIGHDVNYAVTSSVHSAYFGDPRFTPSLIQKELVDAGYLGRKSGRGFYDYADNAERPAASTCDQRDGVEQITLVGNSQIAETLFELAQQAGLNIQREDDNETAIITDNATIQLTDGRMATVRAFEEDTDDLILFDLALDFASCPRVLLSAADQASPQALDEAIGFFQQLGKQVSLIVDIAGMCLMRTVCMLANEGADAVNQQVCEVEAVDIAMKAGVNYPVGPLAWADKIGLDLVLEVLDNLSQNYNEDRYRTSPLIIRKVASGNNFYEESRYE